MAQIPGIPPNGTPQVCTPGTALVTLRALRTLVAEICADVLAIFAAIGLVGISQTDDMLEPVLSSNSPLVIEHSYVANKAIAFNYSLYSDSGMVANHIHDYLRMSLALPNTGQGPSLARMGHLGLRGFGISIAPSSLILVSGGRMGAPQRFGFPPTLVTILVIA